MERKEKLSMKYLFDLNQWGFRARGALVALAALATLGVVSIAQATTDAHLASDYGEGGLTMSDIDAMTNAHTPYEFLHLETYGQTEIPPSPEAIARAMARSEDTPPISNPNPPNPVTGERTAEVQPFTPTWGHDTADLPRVPPTMDGASFPKVPIPTGNPTVNTTVDLPQLPSSAATDRQTGRPRPVVRIGVEWVSEPAVELAAIRRSLLQLEMKLPEYYFDVKFTTKQALEKALLKREMDMFITESAFYLDGLSHGLNALASLVPHSGDEAESAYAGVVIMREDAPFKTLDDALIGPLAIITEEPLSGHLPFKAALTKAGVAIPSRAFHGTHKYGEMRQLVADVQAGRYRAGVVRSCFLEELLIQEGPLAVKGLKVLAPRPTDGLRCMHSTPTYPGWLLSFTPTMPSEIAKDIVDRLIDDPMPLESAFWTLTTNYEKSSDLLRTLKIGPYSYLSLTDAERVIKTYGREIAMVIFIIAILASHGVVVSYKVRRRTAELEAAYARERESQQHTVEVTKKLETLQRLGAVNQMSNIITHELLQPLTTLRNLTRGALRTLEDDPTQTETVGDILTRIETQTDKATQIVERVRSYTKGRREQLSLADRTPLDLQKELKHAVESFKLSSKSAGVTIVVGELDPVTFPMELLDFELIMLNLLSNAADAARTQPDPRVEVTLTKDETYFTLTVRDNGVALTPEFLAKLEASVLETTKPDGLGLGLTIIRHLAGLTLGRLTFEPLETGLAASVTWPLNPPVNRE